MVNWKKRKYFRNTDNASSTQKRMLPTDLTDEQRHLGKLMMLFATANIESDELHEAELPDRFLAADVREQSPFVAEVKPHILLAAFYITLSQACNFSRLRLVRRLICFQKSTSKRFARLSQSIIMMQRISYRKGDVPRRQAEYYCPWQKVTDNCI